MKNYCQPLKNLLQTSSLLDLGGNDAFGLHPPNYWRRQISNLIESLLAIKFH